MAGTIGDRVDEVGVKARLLLLWAALLITLASALAPQGLPASNNTGSAFNPATTSVAIQSRAAGQRAIVQRLVPPPLDPPVAIIGMAAPLPMMLRLMAQRHERSGVDPSSRAFSGFWRQPRAPPVPASIAIL